MAELGKLSRFTVVGLAATAVHFSIIGYFRELAASAPFALNLAASACALAVSFTFHYAWSFRSQVRLAIAVARFLFVWASALALNNVVLALLLELLPMPNIAGVVIAAATIPAFTYMLSRYWVFLRR